MTSENSRYYLNGNDWKFKDFVGEDWVWRNAEKRGTKDVRFWRQGSVPSSVVYDLWKAGEIPDPYYEKNSLSIEWAPERTWIYKKSFTVPEWMKGGEGRPDGKTSSDGKAGTDGKTSPDGSFCRDRRFRRARRFWLHLLGIDYDAKIYLNDVPLGEHHSMYTPVRYDVTDLLCMDGENLLSVVIGKAPEEQPQVGETSLVRTHKSRMTYWWDFCPRMIHQGIWDDVYLETDSGAEISDLWVQTRLPDVWPGEAADRSGSCHSAAGTVPEFAEVTVSAVLGASKQKLKTAVFTPGELTSSPVAEETLAKRADVRVRIAIGLDGKPICGTEYPFTIYEGNTVTSQTFKIEAPKLWYPNGYGDQPLYTVSVSISDSDGVLVETGTRFGIRELKFVPNETSDPTARSYTFHVNGRSIYAKGWNWVPMDVLYGVKRPEKLKRLLNLAKLAGVNCLRVWGGGLIEREDFYDLCDEYGIFVWQEFIQSSSGIDNRPPVDLEYLDFLREEAEQIIPRKRNHPSLALWCGGNELQSAGGGMIRDDEPAIRVLRRVVEELDPGRCFLPSSPSGRIFNNDLRFIEADPDGLHDVHGPWEHQGLTAQYTLYNHGTSLFSSEFGVEGMTNYNTLAKSMDEVHFWPPSRDNYLYFHRGSWWVNAPLVQECFCGQLSEIKPFIRASQFLQYEGLKYAVEAGRRRAFRSSGSLPWQFNEPYPNNYCTCAVDYYAQPKPAYYGVAKAYERSHVSAEFAMQAWGAEDLVTARIFYQDSERADSAVRVEYRYAGASGGAIACGEKTVRTGNPEKAADAGTLSFERKKLTDEIFFLDITAFGEEGTELASARYPFASGTDLTAFLRQEEVCLSVESDEPGVTGEDSSIRILKLKNSGQTAALCVWLQTAGEPCETEWLYFDDNYFTLLPGEEKRVEVRLEGTEKSEVLISGFNVAERIYRL